MAEVPTAWKIANVTALHKKGSKADVANYRPISLTSIVGKVMEIRIRDELLEHVGDNNLFTNHQHGFRKGRSCATQLIEVVHDLTEYIDNKKCVDMIY